MPIPESLREDLYTGVWDLALSGTMHAQRGSFGDGTLLSMRHGLVILWMTACALRFSELRRLEYRDLGPDSIYVTRSKRGKSGMVSVVPKLIAATLAWRSWYVASTVANEPSELLTSLRGGPLNVNVFNRDVCRPLGELFGFRLSSHCFRDSACQYAYAQTSSIRSVQALMGHSSVKTTEHYLRKQQAASFQLLLPGA